MTSKTNTVRFMGSFTYYTKHLLLKPFSGTRVKNHSDLSVVCGKYYCKLCILSGTSSPSLRSVVTPIGSDLYWN